LHKCGQITLDDLEITTSQREPLFVNNAKMELHLAKVAPISQNIKNFQKITIRFANLFNQSYKCRRQINIGQIKITRYFDEDEEKEGREIVF
jgi:hypothetical protein